MDWKDWDWFFGPDAGRSPVSGGPEAPEEEPFPFGGWTEEDPAPEDGDGDSI